VFGLAAVCTGLAFVLFFALIAEIGPTRATLITFANPAIAVVLGALVLDESITLATVGGFVLVITGCWLATRSQDRVVVANVEGLSSLNDVRNASSVS
jgi:drug/metabolite transporter (DMT)-like permease